MRSAHPLILAAALLSSGCASVSPRAGFQDVQTLVSSRTPGTIHWNDGTPADAEVAQAVKTLLSKGLTSDSAVQVALLNNRKIQAKYEQLGIAQAELVQAGLLKNPFLTADVRFGAATSVEGSFVEDFLGILQIPLRKKIAGAALEQTKAEVAGEIFALATDAKKAFYALQAAEQMREFRSIAAKATETSADLASRQRKAGNTSALSLAAEQTLFTQAQLDLAEAEAQVVQTRESVNSVLGLWGDDTQWKTGARLPEPLSADTPLKGLESLAVESRLDLKAVEERLRGAAASLGIATYYRLLPAGGLGLSFDREADSGEWLFGPSLELPIPLFNQGQPAIVVAVSELRKAREEYRALAIEIRSEVRAAQNRMQIARRKAEYYKTVVLPLKREIVDQSQLHSNGMFIGAFQLLQAKRDEIDAGRDYVQALAQYWDARTDLERAIGRSLPQSEPSAPSQPPDTTQNRPHHHGS